MQKGKSKTTKKERTGKGNVSSTIIAAATNLELVTKSADNAVKHDTPTVGE